MLEQFVAALQGERDKAMFAEITGYDFDDMSGRLTPKGGSHEWLSLQENLKNLYKISETFGGRRVTDLWVEHVYRFWQDNHWLYAEDIVFNYINPLFDCCIVSCATPFRRETPPYQTVRAINFYGDAFRGQPTPDLAAITGSFRPGMTILFVKNRSSSHFVSVQIDEKGEWKSGWEINASGCLVPRNGFIEDTVQRILDQSSRSP